MENWLPPEIWQDILESLDFLSQIRLCQISKFFYDTLQITDFLNIPWEFLDKLTDDIIKNYPHIRKLRANKKIINVNHMDRLEILYADGISGIGDTGIEKV